MSACSRTRISNTARAPMALAGCELISEALSGKRAKADGGARKSRIREFFRPRSDCRGQVKADGRGREASPFAAWKDPLRGGGSSAASLNGAPPYPGHARTD